MPIRRIRSTVPWMSASMVSPSITRTTVALDGLALDGLAVDGLAVDGLAVVGTDPAVVPDPHAAANTTSQPGHSFISPRSTSGVRDCGRQIRSMIVPVPMPPPQHMLI